ncbi:MAG TPA: hypothetical protein VF605_06125 [Allosphingosinicella sp.]
MALRLSQALLEETFGHFRTCGAGKRECQALWVGPWSHPDVISRVVHPAHSASPVGFQLDERWLNAFWFDLADRQEGVRAQVHTHPGAAYHSSTDDDFPIIRSEGFLSLVIPRFATGPVGFECAFLAKVKGGHFEDVRIADELEVINA